MKIEFTKKFLISQIVSYFLARYVLRNSYSS